MSSNIVGYQKVTLSKGWNMVGVQFVRVGGDVKNLTDCFVLDDTFAGYDDDYKFSTQMRIWNGDGYDFYGWAGSSGTDVDDDPSLDYTWTDLGPILAQKRSRMLTCRQILEFGLTRRRRGR